MNGNSEEMFIHFAYYRGDTRKKGLIFAAKVSDEEPVIVEMCKEYIPDRIINRLHNNDVRKFYILPYFIFSEMLRICNIRRHQGQGSWISIGRRLAWLGICDEQDADEKRLAEIFPAAGRLIKKYEKDYLSFCYPDKYFGEMLNPEVHTEEWQNMKKYMSAVVNLEQEFVQWCRIQTIGFLYEGIRCHGIRKGIVDSMVEEAWLKEGGIRDRRYWDKRYREWKEMSMDGEDSVDEVKPISAVKLKNEYALSYAANVAAVRYLSLDAKSVWNGDRGRSPEFIQRYLPEMMDGKYCIMEFRNLEQKVLMHQAGISIYAADRSCKYGLGTDETDKLYSYTKRFIDALNRVMDKHSSEEFGEYTLSWVGQALIIRHKTGRVLLINRPQKIENTVYSIRDGYGFMISIPRLIGNLAYQVAEMICLEKSGELIKLGIRTVNVRGCRILANIPFYLNDRVYKEISIKLRIDKYGVNPEFLFGRSSYGNDW